MPAAARAMQPADRLVKEGDKVGGSCLPASMWENSPGSRAVPGEKTAAIHTTTSTAASGGDSAKDHDCGCRPEKNTQHNGGLAEVLGKGTDLCFFATPQFAREGYAGPSSTWLGRAGGKKSARGRLKPYGDLKRKRSEQGGAAGRCGAFHLPEQPGLSKDQRDGASAVGGLVEGALRSRIA